MSKHITADEVLEGLLSASEKSPGPYVRKGGDEFGCVNTEIVDGKVVGSCIVGTFFLDFVGVPSDRLPSIGSYSYVIQILENNGDCTFEPKAKVMLGLAQVMQDGREITWSQISNVMASMEMVLDQHVDSYYSK